MSSEPPIPLAETVPAFETALGLPTPDGKPIVVNKRALTEISNDIAENKDVLRYHNDVAATASMFAKRAIRPDEIAALRRRMFEVVGRGLTEVEQVLAGTKVWSPTQTRLFAILTERVMPKLTNITVEDNSSKKLEDMSIEELETLALGKSKATAVDAVIRQAEVLDEQAEKHERRETKRDVLASLAHTTAIDEAEREYIAKQVATNPDEPASDKHKYQPKHSPESLANVRAARKKTMEEWWREKGFTEEQIAEKRADVQARRVATRAQIRAEKAARLAVAQGLGADEHDMAKAIRSKRNATLAEFKVHGGKGVRSSTALAKEAMARTTEAERRRKREFEPRIYTTKRIAGVPEHLQGKLRLHELRQYRPDLFVPGPSGQGMTEDEVDALVASRIEAEQRQAQAPEGW